jgi:hypothetical protein
MAATSFADWLAAFRELHEQAGRGALSPADQTAYRVGRDELARALLASQRLTLKPSETPRQALRVARAVQVDLALATGNVRTVTIDLGNGGFACRLARAPAHDEHAGVSLRLPGGAAVVCRARVAAIVPQPGTVRVSFQLEALDDESRERLERFVFDTVLAQLAG